MSNSGTNCFPMNTINGRMQSVRAVRVLLVGPLLSDCDVIGGTKVTFTHLVDELSNSPRLELDVVSTTRLPVGSNHWVRQLTRLRAGLRVALACCRAILANDVVMLAAGAPGIFSVAPLVWVLAASVRKPMVTLVYGGQFDVAYERSSAFTKWLARNTFCRSDLWLLETKHLCALFSKRRNVRLFPTVRNFTTSEQPHATECRRFLFLSQVRAEKGIGEALEASAQLPAGSHLTVWGHTRDDTILGRFADYENATYAGSVEPRDVESVMRKHDAFILPSYWHAEGIPGVIIEALQCGLPVIATKWRSIPEIVEHEVNGLLVAARDPESLSEAMNRLAADSSLYQRLCVGARRTGEAYRSEKWLSQLESWLLDLGGRVRNKEEVAESRRQELSEPNRPG